MSTTAQPVSFAVGFFESIGLRPGRLFALAAGLGEVGGGLLAVLGLLGPIGAALMIQVMTVAMLGVHRGHGFFAQSNGVELPLSPEIAWMAIGVALALAFLMLAVRRPPQAAPSPGR